MVLCPEMSCFIYFYFFLKHLSYFCCFKTRSSPKMCHSLPSFCPPRHFKACSLNSNLSKQPETGHLTVCLLRPSRCVRSLVYDTMGAFRGSISVCLWFGLCKYWSPLRPVSSSCQHISGTEIKYRGEEQIS